MTAASDEVQQLQEAVRAVLGVPKEDAPPVLDDAWRDTWPSLAELGVVGFCVPEEAGGFGHRVDVAAAAAVEFGAALHGAPYAALVAAAHAIATSGETALLDAVLDGSRIISFGRLDASGGRAHAVLDAADAGALVLVDGTDVLIADDRSAWTTHPSHAAVDVTRTCADVEVDAARCTRTTTSGRPEALYRLLLAADAVGGVRRSLDRAIAYATHRQAFGRVIGGFQAVQHRLVDHTIAVRGMTEIVTEAAVQLSTAAGDAAATQAAERTVALAELGVSSASVRVLHDLVQLTGAIGFTWEHGLHLFERRAQLDATLVANPRAAIRTVAALEGWISA